MSSHRHNARRDTNAEKTATIATLINEIDEKLQAKNYKATNIFQQHPLQDNCLELENVGSSDLILDLSAHESVNNVALEHFTVLGDNVTIAALQLACRYNWKDVVDLLLPKVNMNERPPKRIGDAPLIIAAT